MLLQLLGKDERTIKLHYKYMSMTKIGSNGKKYVVQVINEMGANQWTTIGKSKILWMAKSIRGKWIKNKIKNNTDYLIIE